MSSDKRTNQWGTLAKVEGSYGTDATPDGATDGLLLAERPEFGYDFVHDGSRVGDMAPQSRGPAPRVAPSGRFGETSFSAEAIGAGAAYASSALPSLDVLLRIACFDATVDVTAGSEMVTYTPATSGFESATIESYARGQLDKLTGAYAKSFTIGSDGPGVPQWQFDVVGIAAVESDAVIPSITSYPVATLLPAKANNIQFTIDGESNFVVRSWSFDLGQDMSPRADENSSGHAGYTPAGLSPTLEVTVEALPTTTFDPFTLRDQRGIIAASLQVGSTQYNRWKLNADQVQILTVEDDADGASALWKLTLGLYPSSYTLADYLSIVFD